MSAEVLVTDLLFELVANLLFDGTAGGFHNNQCFIVWQC